MKLLVAGGAAHDAGKTTFATGLTEYSGIGGYKPRAGNDYWYDHADCRRAVERGRLYGKDADRLSAVSPRKVGPEAINAVHRLWQPAPGGGRGLLDRPDRTFLVDRVTVAGKDEFVVNGTAELPTPLRRDLPLDEATVVETLSALDELMVDLHARALSALADEIARRDDAIVESYADVARPLSAFVPDAIAVVEPRRCRIYDGDRYAKACEVATGGTNRGRLERSVGRVVGLLDPIVTVRLPALTTDEARDPSFVADTYADVYDELLAAT